MTKPILFAHPFSPYSRKARLALLHCGVEHEYRMTAPHADDPEFRAASPLGKIPAFADGEASFADSSVIVHYLNRFHDGAKLLPSGRADFARALWFEEYADTVMTPVIGGHLFAEVVLAKRVFQREPLQSDIDKAINQELPVIYAFLNKQLEGRTWLVGEQVSLADLAVGGLLLALYHCGQSVPDTAPHLQAYVQRVFALEAMQKVLAQELQVFAGLKYDSPLAA